MGTAQFPATVGGGSSSNTIITGSGAPTSGIGNNGDVYLDSTASVLYLKSAGAWNAGTSLIGGANAAPVAGVVYTSPTQTWSASGSSFSWTVPTTVNGQSVTKLVILDVVGRLMSGTPGTSATYGLTIAGNSPFTARALPTQGGGVDVTMMNLNSNNLSGTYKQAGPGDTITITSGGTFSGSTTWQFDLIGYYVGLSPGSAVQGVEFMYTAGNTFNPPGASATLPCVDNTNAAAFWTAPAAGYLKGISGYISARGSGTPNGTAQLAVLKNQSYTTNGSSALTVNGTNIGQTSALSAPALSAETKGYVTGLSSGNSFAAGDQLMPVCITSSGMTASFVLQFVVHFFVQMTAI